MFERYRRLFSLAMALMDVVLINLAFAAAYWVRYDLQWFRAVDPAYDAPFRAYIPFALALTILLLTAYKLGRVYDQPRSPPGSMRSTLFSAAPPQASSS